VTSSIVAAVREKLAKSGDLPSQRGEAGVLPVHDVVRESSPAIAPVGREKPDVPPESSPGEAAREPEAKPAEDRDYNQLREQLRKSESARKQAERDLTAARAERETKTDLVDAVLNVEKPKGFEDWDAERQQAWGRGHAAREVLKAQWGETGLGDITKILGAWRASSEVTDLSPSQAEIVSEIHSQAGGAINYDEAKAIASQRQPDLFPQPAPAPVEEVDTEPLATPRVQEPSRSGHRREEPDPMGEMSADVRGAESVGQAKGAMARLVRERLGRSGMLPSQR